MGTFKVVSGGTEDDNRDVQREIGEIVRNNEVVIFMKGTPLQPRCGFSARAVEILNNYQLNFVAIDVLTDQGIREGVKVYANWPTIPQVYFKGEFVGGSDILLEMHEAGELEELFK